MHGPPPWGWPGTTLGKPRWALFKNSPRMRFCPPPPLGKTGTIPGRPRSLSGGMPGTILERFR